MRKIFAATAALALALTMSGCSHSANDMYSGLEAKCGEYVQGENAKNVTVSDVSGSSVPKVSFAPGIDSAAIETAVVKEGSGPKITGSQTINVDLVSLGGSSATVLRQTAFNGTDTISEYLTPPTDPAAPTLCNALGGVREGSQVVVLVPKSVTGGTESAVLFLQINKVNLPHAVGDAVGNLETGIPNVVRDTTNGKPSVQWTSAAAPADLKVVTLIKGWGEPLKSNAGQAINVHYRVWVWGSQVEADSSWSRETPYDTQLQSDAVVEGWVKGLDGVTVGSQVMLIVPPSLGYGDVDKGEAIPANSTLVFVIDVLGASSSK